MATLSTPLVSTPPEGFARRLLGDLRALAAVSRKEWLYFVRYPSWIINMIIWPLIFPLAYILSARALSGPDGSGLALFTARTGITDYMGFIAIGTTVWMWQNVVLWNVGFALRNEQMRGTLESSWMTPAWRFAFLIGPSAVQLISMLMFLAVSALEFGLFFGVRLHGNPLLVLLLLVLSMPSIYGLGMAFASLVITAKEAHNFVFIVRGFVMVFCGVTFPISILPGWMQVAAGWLPQTYMMHGIRMAALAGASFTDLIPDMVALIGFGAFWLVAGYVIFNWMERRARQTGAIGQY
jgi:ABC-2 type transport system permease protein